MAAVRHGGRSGDQSRKGRINERLSHARVATLVCGCGLRRTGGSGVTFRARNGGRLKEGQLMAHLGDKEFVQRANTVLLLGGLWGGRGVFVICALAYDIAYWLQDVGGTHTGRIASLFELTTSLQSDAESPATSSRVLFIRGKVRRVFSTASREANAFRRDLDNENA